ncbi:MAG: DUF456 domain-containing protein [Bacteroides sp.]|nr:DUF456 domain-containing protein [Bacteroides sp.]
MDIFLIFIASFCLLTGFVGCIIPGVPGLPFAYLGMIVLQITERVQFSVAQMLIWLGLVIVVQIIDYLTPMWGTRRWGGSKAGIWGSMIGTLAGVVLFPPWGILIGPFVGAFIGEIINERSFEKATRAGYGALIGFMAGTALKLVVCGVLIFYFVKALLA